jgi:hypothetical protein
MWGSAILSVLRSYLLNTPQPNPQAWFAIYDVYLIYFIEFDVYTMLVVAFIIQLSNRFLPLFLALYSNASALEINSLSLLPKEGVVSASPMLAVK